MKKFLSAAVAIAIIMNSLLCANVLSSNVCEAAQEDINMEYTYDMLRNREGNKVYTITLPADYGVDVETLSGTVSKKEGLTFWRAVKNILYTVFFVYFLSGILDPYDPHAGSVLLLRKKTCASVNEPGSGISFCYI